MLSVSLYENSSELFNLDFVCEKEKEIIVVCPSPLLADDFRSQFSKNQTLTDINVVTISKFMSEELKKTQRDINVKRKADLIIELSTFWKSRFPDLGHETFFQAFNLFTELRSFTVDSSLVNEILSEFDPVIAEAVLRFWAVVDHLEIIDEQASYNLLSEFYRTPDTESYEKKNIIIAGFNHLNAGQVDLVKALGIRHDVYIPFPKDVFSETTASDWVRWLHPEELKTTQLESEEKNVQVVSFAKNRLSEKLGDFFHADKLESGADLFLGVKNPDLNQLNEVSFGGYFFKAKNDLFNTLVSNVIESLKQLFITSSLKEIPSSQIVEFLEKELLKELEKSIEDKNFRLIKAINLVKNKVVELQELPEQAENFNLLDIQICDYVVRLNLPRTFSAPLIEGQVKGVIRGLEGIEGFDSNAQTIICVSSQYTGIKGSDNKFNEEVMKFLATIGPVQRKELEYKLIKKRLKEVLVSSKTVLFLEQGLTEHDLGWSEILEGLELNEIDLGYKRESKKTVDYIKASISKKAGEIKRYSASRLQTYIDCPRKYYFQYVDKLDVRPQTDCNVRPDQLGTLEHDVIGFYLEANNEWNSQKHNELVKEKFDEFIKEEGISLSEFSYDRFFIEIRDYSKTGITNLLKLKELDPKVEFKFEEDIAKLSPHLAGRIDCLAIGDFGIGMIDFKRSQASIPSNTEIERFEKIQVWFYLHHYNPGNRQYAFWGFMNLSEADSSRMYVADKEIATHLSSVGFLDKCRFIGQDNLESYLEEYAKFENKILDDIKVDQNFSPLPRKSDVCTFCTVTNICPRRVIGDVS